MVLACMLLIACGAPAEEAAPAAAAQPEQEKPNDDDWDILERIFSKKR